MKYLYGVVTLLGLLWVGTSNSDAHIFRRGCNGVAARSCHGLFHRRAVSGCNGSCNGSKLSCDGVNHGASDWAPTPAPPMPTEGT